MTRAPKYLLIFAMLASAAPLDLSAWKYRKKIPLTPGDGIAVVKLDRQVYGAIGSRYYKLRIYRENEEVPFVFGTASPIAHERVDVREEILDQSILPGVGLQFTIHRQSSGTHNSINIFTDLKNFRNKVRIEASQDGVHWSVARDDGAIFNFSQDDREFSSTTVGYPVSTKPFLRVSIFGWTKNGSVTGAVIDRFEETRETFEVFATAMAQVSQDSATNTTMAMVDLGITGLPVDYLRLESPSPQFQRAVGVETSDDAQNWSYAGGSTIARLPGTDYKQESLTIPVSGGHRYFKLRVYNRDDKPIQIGKVQAEGRGNQIGFLASTPGNYWLYYDGLEPERAQMPEYDLPAVLSKQSLPEHVWPLGAQEPNPLFKLPGPPKKPWSEQHPAVLYTVLGAVVLGLGAVTFRFASRLRATP